MCLENRFHEVDPLKACAGYTRKDGVCYLQNVDMMIKKQPIPKTSNGFSKQIKPSEKLQKLNSRASREVVWPG